jgi:uncharacterized protein (TIGR02246 family)
MRQIGRRQREIDRQKNKGEIIVSSENEVRELFNEWADAIRGRDLEGVMKHYAPDVESFDVVDPLRYSGKESGKERTKNWFATFEDDIGLEVRDLTVAASETVAFCHSLNRYSEKETGKNKIDMWVRVTLCWQNIDGVWQIVHQHSSVPFNPETGQASLNIQP